MRRTLPELAAAVLAAGSVIGGLTLTAASASQSATPTEHFRVISTTATSRHLSMVATGHFTAGGYERPGKLVNQRAADRVVFPSGRFTMHRHVTHQSVSLPKSCLFTEVLRGTYWLGSGTGRYKKIHGSGNFDLQITGVIKRSHGVCSATGKMSAYQRITYASGPARF
jgi:hypothetical protein